MKNLKYNKSNSDKVTIKGIINEDGTGIVYESDDGEAALMDIKSCLKVFAGQEVSFTVTSKKDTDCTDDLIEEDA